jgi:hypothetical protein
MAISVRFAKHLVIAAAAGLLGAASVDAATFVVTTVGDSGAGSLRQAILNANAIPGDDTILFQLPPSLSAPFDRARVCLAESEQQRGDRE